MIQQLLTDIGLNQTQAKLYISLIKYGAQTPPEIAKRTKLTRTNAYKALDTLVAMNLAEKQEKFGKFTYTAQNPSGLEAMAKQRRNEAIRREAQLQSNLPTLISYFFTHSNQPGIRFFEGVAGLKEIFNDVMRTGQDEYLIRSGQDVQLLDRSFFLEFRRKQAKAGITTYAITPDIPDAIRDPALDKLNKFTRTWISAKDYTAPVEWKIYGNKVAIISYGSEVLGMIIESPQIAESMRQIFRLAQAASLTDS